MGSIFLIISGFFASTAALLLIVALWDSDLFLADGNELLVIFLLGFLSIASFLSVWLPSYLSPFF